MLNNVHPVSIALPLFSPVELRVVLVRTLSSRSIGISFSRLYSRADCSPLDSIDPSREKGIDI